MADDVEVAEGRQVDHPVVVVTAKYKGNRKKSLLCFYTTKKYEGNGKKSFLCFYEHEASVVVGATRPH